MGVVVVRQEVLHLRKQRGCLVAKEQCKDGKMGRSVGAEKGREKALWWLEAGGRGRGRGSAGSVMAGASNLRFPRIWCGRLLSVTAGSNALYLANNTFGSRQESVVCSL